MTTRTPVSFTIETREVPTIPEPTSRDYATVETELVMQAGGTRVVLWSDVGFQLNGGVSDGEFDPESQAVSDIINTLSSLPEAMIERLNAASERVEGLEERLNVVEGKIEDRVR